jgi:hypothetical protein
LNASQIVRKSSRETGTVRSMPVISATKSGCSGLTLTRVASSVMNSSSRVLLYEDGVSWRAFE